MKEMIRKYRGTLISSALVILAGVLVGFTSIQGKWINLFFVVMQCVFVAIIFYDNRNRQQNRKVIGMTIWIIPVITLIYNGIARLVNMGADTENLFMALIYYGTGLMFMKKTGMQRIDSVERYGWHQVFCVCFAVFLQKA